MRCRTRVHLCIWGSGVVTGENWSKFLCAMNLHVVESISMLSRFVKAFLSGSKHFFISWLQPLSTVNLRSWRLPKLSLNSWWLKNIWNTSASLVPSFSFIPLIHSRSATLTSYSSHTPKSISASGPLHILFPLAQMPFPMIFLWLFLLSSFQALGILQFNSKITLVHWFNKASPQPVDTSAVN